MHHKSKHKNPKSTLTKPNQTATKHLDNIDSLPFELKNKIASFLPFTSLVSFGLISKEWYQISLSEPLWEMIYLHHFSSTHPHAKGQAELQATHTSYTKYQEDFESWNPSSESPTFWKSICEEAFNDRMWLPPTRPSLREIKQMVPVLTSNGTIPIPRVKIALLGSGGVGLYFFIFVLIFFSQGNHVL